PSTDESHYLKEDEVLEAILQDLMNKDKVAEKDRRFVRYFSTANLFNAMLIEMKLLEGRLAGEGSFSTSSRILGYLGEVTAKNFAKKAYEQLREKNLKTYQRGLSMLLNSSTAEDFPGFSADCR
ncbi:MAG: hypothetical protein JO034_22240, partial [Singulisphaera sp.]|nr:hypothetical protein [Singulisphaera sp.]